MKKLFVLFATLVALVLPITSFAQTTPQGKSTDQVTAKSYSYAVKDGKVGITYLHDGLGTSMAGIDYKAWKAGDRWTINVTAVSDFKDTNKQYWAGSTVSYRLTNPKSAVKFDFVAGLKGFNISNGFSGLRLEKKGQFVFGFNLTFPIPSSS